MIALAQFFRRARGPRNERGATALEFAIILPLFLMITFGMFTGGILYDRRQALNHAIREGSRFGATVPLNQYATGAATIDGTAWTSAVWNVVVQRSDELLTQTGTMGCVAVIRDNPVERYPSDGTPFLYTTGGYTTVNDSAGNPICFDDGGADGSTRVQVAASTPGELNAIFFSMTVNLTGRGISRHESTS